MITAIMSAPTMENHIPSNPQISGKMSTATISKTIVLKKEIIAEMRPLFNNI